MLIEFCCEGTVTTFRSVCWRPWLMKLSEIAQEGVLLYWVSSVLWWGCRHPGLMPKIHRLLVASLLHHSLDDPEPSAGFCFCQTPKHDAAFQHLAGHAWQEGGYRIKIKYTDDLKKKNVTVFFNGSMNAYCFKSVNNRVWWSKRLYNLK